MNDLIDRQAAIDVAFDTFPDDEYFREQFVKGIEALPSAQLVQDLHNACTDTISRQAAIDALSCINPTETYIKYDEAVTVIKALPFAQPERKKGRWIPQEGWDGDENYECSECKVLWTFPDGTPEDNGANFCPNCGADMREEND